MQQVYLLMPTSNADIIRDALGLIGVLEETETASAEQGEHGLRVLNDTLSDWDADGVDLQWYEQTELAAEPPLPRSSILAVKHYLAMALAPYYGREISPEFRILASQYYARLVRESVAPKMRPTDLSGMTKGEGQTEVFDFTTG